MPSPDKDKHPDLGGSQAAEIAWRTRARTRLGSREKYAVSSISGSARSARSPTTIPSLGSSMTEVTDPEEIDFSLSSKSQSMCAGDSSEEENHSDQARSRRITIKRLQEELASIQHDHDVLSLNYSSLDEKMKMTEDLYQREIEMNTVAEHRIDELGTLLSDARNGARAVNKELKAMKQLNILLEDLVGAFSKDRGW